MEKRPQLQNATTGRQEGTAHEASVLSIVGSVCFVIPSVRVGSTGLRKYATAGGKIPSVRVGSTLPPMPLFPHCIDRFSDLNKRFDQIERIFGIVEGQSLIELHRIGALMNDDPKKLISDLIGLLETLSEQSKLGGVFSSTADQGANAFRQFLSGEVDSLDKAFGVIKCEEHPKITLGEYAYKDQARYIIVQALFPATGKSKGKSAKEIAAGVYARSGIKIDEREVRRCLDRYSTEILGEILADEFSRGVAGKYPIDDLSDRLVEEPHTENADKN